MNIVNMVVDFDGIMQDSKASTLKGGASVKSPYNVVNVDAYVGYGIPENELKNTQNAVTIKMTVEHTSIETPVDQQVTFTLLPERCNGIKTTLDWLPDANDLMVKMDETQSANCDSYMTIKQGTDSGVTVTAGFSDDEGQAWTISWDPAIIIIDI